MGAQVYDPEFRPVLLPGETAHLITQQGMVDIECVAVGALPEYTKDFGALVAATWTTDQEDENLELSDMELGQYRMQVLSDVKLRFNNLSPTRQWRTSKTDFTLGQFPQNEHDDFIKNLKFMQSEFFVYKDDTPRFDLYSDIATVECLVEFTGWRYYVRKISVRGKISIWVSGWPSGGVA